MNGNDLIKLLQDYKDHEIVISVDVSTGEADAGNRAFGTDVFGIQENSPKCKNGPGEASLMFEGNLNFEEQG